MKKIVSLLLVGFLSLFITGCDTGEENENDSFKEQGIVALNDYFLVHVKNEEDFVAELNISVDFMNESGEVIFTDTDTVLGISPGEEAVRIMYAAPLEFSDYKITVDAVKSSYFSYFKDIEIVDVNLDDGYVNVTFNSSATKELSYILYTVVFYEDDKIVGAVESFISEVEEGEVADKVRVPLKYGEEIEFDDYEVMLHSAYRIVE